MIQIYLVSQLSPLYRVSYAECHLKECVLLSFIMVSL
jgi:hypothetical protein